MTTTITGRWQRIVAVMTMALMVVSIVTAQQDDPLSLEQLRAQRREMAHKPRRIIANNDGCDCLYFPRNTELTVQSFLDRRTTDLAGTQVDTIAYCTISSGFSNFTHDTKVGTLLTRQSADYDILPNMRNVAQDLIDLGSDSLKSVVDFGHANGIEVFWSMRMNDTHDVAHTPEKPYMLFPPLKEEHPEWLMSDHIKRTPYGRWSSVNYAVPEIRELAFRFIEEVCRNYDVDGIEMDFFRHLCYFKSVAFGGVASDEERGMMTDLIRRVRAMTEEVGRERGRPILISVRVPDSADYCRDMGLDIERWLSEDLVDILIPTGYFRLNPWDYSVQLAHSHDAAVWPCLADSRVRGETRFRRGRIESYRGRAMNAWTAGADGVHTFNLFYPKSAVFREIGDPAAMATLNKLYFATVRYDRPDRWLAGGDKYLNTPVLTPSHPMSVRPGQPVDIDITVGEDFAAARAAGGEPTVALHVELPGIKAPEQFLVTLNDRALTDGTITDGWLDLPLQPEWLKRGSNHVRIALNPDYQTAPDEWNIVWEGGEPPRAPWYRDAGSARTEVKTEGDALLIADRGEVSGDYCYYRYAWGAEPGETLVVEAQAKVVSGGSFIIICNGQAQERLGLWPDRVELYMHNDISFKMDTTDDFHTYRIEVTGEDLKVYVDGELRLEAPGSFNKGGSKLKMLAFGAANSTMVGEAWWKSVRARLNSQSCRDLVVSVDYK
ncbi:MAG: hypothetical protein J7M38_05180 [Armatimonadetes bacterium]|nr:hypothetical protein [Armatimonadota bacterium]